MEYLLDYPDVGFSGNIYEAENDRTYSLNTMPLEYAGSGVGDFRVPAVTVRHADGSQALDLRFQKYFIRKGKYSIPGLPAVYAEENEAETLEILMKDTASETEVHLFYGVLEEADAITRSVTIINREVCQSCLSVHIVFAWIFRTEIGTGFIFTEDIRWNDRQNVPHYFTEFRKAAVQEEHQVISRIHQFCSARETVQKKMGSVWERY